ncbi:hypothetical protein ElyMa_002336100 [Elysia marginata]|uniref:Uncharacterized protein n=1 Tax=Elysia marginata TaxID=1093978 RepID=A0AAV4G8D5_9GAST|nr:hypothetical protein ElyMa_002336100 [Elysia marginata]
MLRWPPQESAAWINTWTPTCSIDLWSSVTDCLPGALCLAWSERAGETRTDQAATPPPTTTIKNKTSNNNNNIKTNCNINNNNNSNNNIIYTTTTTTNNHNSNNINNNIIINTNICSNIKVINLNQ